MDYEVKADALEESFDAVEMKPERPVLVAEAPAYLTAFDSFVRRGETGGVKSFSGATTQDGGFAVPREIDSVIDATLKTISPIRRVANVVRVGTAGYRKPARRRSTKSCRRWVTFMPIRRRRSSCLMMPRSMSKRGYRARSRPNLRGPKERRS
jgi:HK97 family phage major capsid protein